MVRAFKPKKYYIELPRASQKLSQAEPSFWKHGACETNFEPSLGSTQPYLEPYFIGWQKMGDFFNIFPSKLNLEPTEPPVCPKKPNLGPTEPQTRIDPTLLHRECGTRFF